MRRLETSEKVFDSPRGWVARHIRRYVETDGRSGHRWSGVNSLLLTTRGRRSGKLRRTGLIYGRDGDRYIVVGSNGGARLMASIWPEYDRYQARIKREIPVVVLDRSAAN